ncbi:hypothetical protein K438DRAFT_2051456 [Mycena galopus ATCC 62051]|nr:hypothetical protein K438DRAFT_2051456 [Mycena galopus ATCC 62051]
MPAIRAAPHYGVVPVPRTSQDILEEAADNPASDVARMYPAEGALIETARAVVNDAWVASDVRTSQGREVPDIQSVFQGRNIAAEGELRVESLLAADQDAWCINSVHREFFSDRGAKWYSRDQPEYNMRAEYQGIFQSSLSVNPPVGLSNGSPNTARTSSLDAVNMESPGVFLPPKTTARKGLQILKPMEVGNKNFPTWFASEFDAETSPHNRIVREELLRDDDPVNSKPETVNGHSVDDSRAEYVSIMAIAVEAETTHQVKAPKRGSPREKSTGSTAKRQYAGTQQFGRPKSQLPEGGWFRATTSKETVRDFARNVQFLAKRVPDISKRQLVQIFWDGVERSIRVKWLDHGMNPEETSLKRLMRWAIQFEAAKDVMEAEEAWDRRATEESDADVNEVLSSKKGKHHKVTGKHRSSKSSAISAIRYGYSSSSDELVLSKPITTSESDSEKDNDLLESGSYAEDEDEEETNSDASFD